jgi:hypothetical protein
MTQSSAQRANRHRVHGWGDPIVTTTLLAVGSYFLVGNFAGGEPFCCLRAQDAFLYAGVGSIVFVLWCLNLIHIVRTIASNRRRLELGIPAAVTVLGVLLVVHVPIGYFRDLERFHCSETGRCLGLRGQPRE